MHFLWDWKQADKSLCFFYMGYFMVLLAITRKKEIVDMQIGKKVVEVSICRTMISYIKKPNGSSKKLLELCSKLT